MIDMLTYSLCRSAINESIKQVSNFSFKVVSKLPDKGEKTFVYLVKKTTNDPQDKYDEYIWLNDSWEYLGNADIALTQYLKKSEYKQPDWNQTNPEASDYIKNKIDLNQYLRKDEQKQPDWNQSDSSQPDYIKNKADLSIFLKKTDYKQSDWNQINPKESDFIKNKPTVIAGIGTDAEAFNGNTPQSATGENSHSEGKNTKAKGNSSHSEGSDTVAASLNQHVQGKNNIIDDKNIYAHIVGNGSTSVPSNAHTLDWKGNSWYQSSVLIGGEDMTKSKAGLYSNSVILNSSDSGSVKQFKIAISDKGLLTVTDLETKSEVPILLDTPETIQRIADAVIANIPKATEVNF